MDLQMFLIDEVLGFLHRWKVINDLDAMGYK